ncbi:MAG: phosphoribosylamine--glycine ligase, partial [Rhodospirillaceae bacterium]|nr:phosphoribosylamine--glycine ligase [Rhodospirillaceae bacterium]
SAQDHKAAFDGDKGPNTGGMGAYAPAPIMTEFQIDAVMERIILPTIKGMKAEGRPYKGVLFAGLMITSDGPQLIEHNVRFGDPECQVLMTLIRSDILPALIAAHDGVLKTFDLRWRDEVAMSVVMAAQGYPDGYEKGSSINNLDAAEADEDVFVFHAGTDRDAQGQLIATGGRVLNVTGVGASVGEAQAKAYNAIDRIDWPEGFCRRDIGWRAIARETKDA